MYSNYCNKQLWLFSVCCLLFGMTLSTQAQNNDSQKTQHTILQATPNKCITVREGRQCSAKVTLFWSTEQNVSVCLKQASEENALKCWDKQKEGEYLLKFKQAQSTEYVLVNEDDQQVISQVWVTVGWVYEQQKNSRRWQLF